MELDRRTIALFIDADNAPAGQFDRVISELAKFGVLSIRKAYGNWNGSRLNSWIDILHEYAIQPIQQFDLTKGKNATDMAMTIDVMDVLYAKNIDVFCIVSSDCDFTPLVTRLVSDGKEVIGFGERKAPDVFVNACSKFLYLEECSKDGSTAVPSKSDPLKGNSKLIKTLRNAVEACDEGEGWAPLAGVGSHLINQGSFDQRNFGFKKLSDLFKAIDLFDVKKSNSGLSWVKDIRS